VKFVYGAVVQYWLQLLSAFGVFGKICLICFGALFAFGLFMAIVQRLASYLFSDLIKKIENSQILTGILGLVAISVWVFIISAIIGNRIMTINA
jgi:hypothetical protein